MKNDFVFFALLFMVDIKQTKSKQVKLNELKHANASNYIFIEENEKKNIDDIFR